jgi:putative holliday junction resolvase
MRETGAILAFDFGSKRIGVAVGELSIGIAHPVTTIHAESNSARLDAVAALVTEWRPVRFVVGEPQHQIEQNTDVPHPVAHLAKKFGNRLHEKFKLPVIYVNETLSSSEASAQMATQGVHGRAQKRELDAAAAQVILQSYFDEERRRTNQEKILKAQHAA